MAESPPRAAKRILVVDDSEDMRTFQAMALEEAGYDVLQAPDAEVAFALARSAAPDVIITDIIMNGPSGLDLISRIRSDLPPPLPPIIACSGLWELESEALRRGATLFLAKPFVAVDLVGVVAEVLNGLSGVSMTGEAQRRSRWLRERIVESAAALLGSTTKPAGELAKRADWTVEWLSAYLGFGCASILFVTEGDLRVLSSSNPASLARGERVTGRLRLARDVVESGSTVVLGDVAAYFPPVEIDGAVLRFFAGVPLFGPNRAAVGSLCLFDPQPQLLEADDLAILEHIGRLGSDSIAALMAGQASSHFLDGPMIMSRAAFEVTLGCELRRARQHRLAVEIVIFKLGQPLPPSALRETVQGAMSPRRTGVSFFAPDQLAVYVTREEPAMGAAELAALMRGLRGLTGVRAAGAISILGDVIPGVGERDLISVARTLADHDTRGAHGELERIVLRRETWLAGQNKDRRPDDGRHKETS